MRLLIVNSVLGFGSTGRIVLGIAKEYEKNGYEVKIAYGRNMGSLPKDVTKYGVRIGNDMDVYCHVMYTRLTDKHGLASKNATKSFLRWAETYNPDILWLHNIHGYYINYELLFEWIKSRPQMQVKWTLHDCWAFTGHCSHFTYVNCAKWRDGCSNCPQLDQYPNAICDNSQSNYERKKAAFTGISNLTIITPSNWLKERVKQGFLAEYLVDVMYNTVDKSIFKPTQSTFKCDYGIQDKKMVLGVSSIWNDRKGLDDFVQLSKLLDRTSYQIVLVGLSQSQINELLQSKTNILGLPRTSSAEELAGIYSAADVFVNPSYEETFSLTTAEAQACGTYSVVYKETACEEVLDKCCGEAVDANSEAVLQAVVSHCEMSKTDSE